MHRTIFTFLLTLLLPLTVLAADPVLKIATSQYPPFEYTANGRVTGSDAELVRRVVRQMGYQPEIELLPWIRAEARVMAGDADLIFSLTRSEKRDRYYYFTAPLNTVQDVLYKHRNRNLQWQDYDDLTGLRIGLSASYSYAPDFMAWLEEGKALSVTAVSHEHPELSSLKMLAFGRIDVFICERSVCDYLIRTHGDEFPELLQLEAMPGSVGPQRTFHAAISRQHPEGRALRDQFDRALAQLRD